MFDVYVDGATGPSREAVRELASAMAARYRLPAAELEARLTRGRFRVKAGVDRATAEAYLRDLAAIGARVRIEPAGPPPPETRPARSSLPAQPESRPARSSLPPSTEARATRPPQAPSTEPRFGPPPQAPSTEPRFAPPSLPPPPGPRPARSSLPPQPEPRPARSSLPPLGGSPVLPAGSGGRPGGGGVVAPTGPMATLGALDRSGALSLATLDDEPAQSSATDGVLPASMGPAAPRPARPVRPRNEPADPFAPPELAAEEPLLQLADEDVAHRTRKQASAPPPIAGAGPPARTGAASSPPASVRAPVMAPDRPLPGTSAGALQGQPLPGRSAGALQGQPLPGRSAGALQGQPLPGTSTGALQGQPLPGRSAGALQGQPAPPAVPPAGVMPLALPAVGSPPGSGAPVSALGSAFRKLGSELVARLPVLGSARVQLVAGVALAIALGFVPAHLVGGMRERSAYGAIDAKVIAVQSTADTPDSYAALDAFRAAQLDAKYSARRSIAVTSLVVWAAVAAALALGWFSLFRTAGGSTGRHARSAQ